MTRATPHLGFRTHPKSENARVGRDLSFRSSRSRGARRFLPRSPGDPAGGMVMAHRLGDHLGCHVLAAELFCGHDWLSTGVDWPGHGFSEGKRGHIEGVGTAVELIEESCRFLRGQIGPDAPLGLYAHSTGALFALHFLEMNEQGVFGEPTLFDRIWFGSPLLRPGHGHHPVKVWGAGLVGKIMPGLILDTGVRPEQCRHVDPEAAKANGDYDLCHHYVSAGLGADLLRHGSRIDSTAGALKDPSRILLTQGAEDSICPAEFSESFSKRFRPATALLPRLFHEPLRGAIANSSRRWTGGCPPDHVSASMLENGNSIGVWRPKIVTMMETVYWS